MAHAHDPVSNYDLRASVKSWSTAASDSLQPGVILPALSGIGVSGEKIAIDYAEGQKKILLLSFAPGCEYCEANMPNWKDFIETPETHDFRVVAVSLVSEGVGDYVSHHNMNHMHVVAKLDPDVRRAYKLRQAPQTIVINGDGRLKKIFTGILKSEDQKEIRGLLGLGPLISKEQE